MPNFKPLFAAFALFSAAALSGGCAGALQGELTPVENLAVTQDNGAAQVMLEPVDVWDDQGAAEAAEAEVDGRKIHVRKRGSALFRQAWVRLGLFWSAKRPNDVFIAAVALGPEVQVRSLRMEIDGQAVELEPTNDFQFTPGKRGPLDNQDKHSAAFVADLDWLRDVVQSRESVVVALETNRGVLAGDLNVVAGDTQNALRESAKNMFAEFLEAQRQAARN